METSVITIKGQILIPKRIRKKFGFHPRTRLVFVEHKGDVIIRKLDQAYFERFAGILLGKGDVVKGLLDDKRREREP